jgi:hypothetical protein
VDCEKAAKTEAMRMADAIERVFMTVGNHGASPSDPQRKNRAKLFATPDWDEGNSTRR